MAGLLMGRMQWKPDRARKIMARETAHHPYPL